MTQLNEILKLSVSEKILMVEAIWDSIDSDSKASEVKLSDNTKKVLDERLSQYSKSPNTVSTWEQVKSRIEADL